MSRPSVQLLGYATLSFTTASPVLVAETAAVRPAAVERGMAGLFPGHTCR